MSHKPSYNNRRSALNSAAYLLPSIEPHMSILDVGCGPGVITIDLAELVPQGQVIGLEYAPAVLEQGRATAAERGVKNVQFQTGDVHAMQFPDATFDVVHAHQVLQHVRDPVQALREMRRVCKPGGIVACRETDIETSTWFPDVQGMQGWLEMYIKVARSSGGEPNAGRRLHAWARQAGYDLEQIRRSAGALCFSTPDEREWWSELWAGNTVSSWVAKPAIERGIATQDELNYFADVWRKWGKEEDGWFAILTGEILCRV